MAAPVIQKGPVRDIAAGDFRTGGMRAIEAQMKRVQAKFTGDTLLYISRATITKVEQAKNRRVASTLRDDDIDDENIVSAASAIPYGQGARAALRFPTDPCLKEGNLRLYNHNYGLATLSIESPVYRRDKPSSGGRGSRARFGMESQRRSVQVFGYWPSLITSTWTVACFVRPHWMRNSGLFSVIVHPEVAPMRLEPKNVLPRVITDMIPEIARKSGDPGALPVLRSLCSSRKAVRDAVLGTHIGADLELVESQEDRNGLLQQHLLNMGRVLRLVMEACAANHDLLQWFFWEQAQELLPYYGYDARVGRRLRQTGDQANCVMRVLSPAITYNAAALGADDEASRPLYGPLEDGDALDGFQEIVDPATTFRDLVAFPLYHALKANARVGEPRENGTARLLLLYAAMFGSARLFGTEACRMIEALRHLWANEKAYTERFGLGMADIVERARSRSWELRRPPPLDARSHLLLGFRRFCTGAISELVPELDEVAIRDLTRANLGPEQFARLQRDLTAEWGRNEAATRYAAVWAYHCVCKVECFGEDLGRRFARNDRGTFTMFQYQAGSDTTFLSTVVKNCTGNKHVRMSGRVVLAAVRWLVDVGVLQATPITAEHAARSADVSSCPSLAPSTRSRGDERRDVEQSLKERGGHQSLEEWETVNVSYKNVNFHDQCLTLDEVHLEKVAYAEALRTLAGRWPGAIPGSDGRLVRGGSDRFEPSEDQQAAWDTLFSRPVAFLGGAAGTGKTTIMVRAAATFTDDIPELHVVSCIFTALQNATCDMLGKKVSRHRVATCAWLNVSRFAASQQANFADALLEKYGHPLGCHRDAAGLVAAALSDPQSQARRALDEIVESGGLTVLRASKPTKKGAPPEKKQKFIKLPPFWSWHVRMLFVDEMSMVGLPLASRLLQTAVARLPALVSLVVVGDPNQIPSVEYGHVLYEMQRSVPGRMLETSHRARNRGLRRLASSVVRNRLAMVDAEWIDIPLPLLLSNRASATTELAQLAQSGACLRIADIDRRKGSHQTREGAAALLQVLQAIQNRLPGYGNEAETAYIGYRRNGDDKTAEVKIINRATRTNRHGPDSPMTGFYAGDSLCASAITSTINPGGAVIYTREILQALGWIDLDPRVRPAASRTKGTKSNRAGGGGASSKQMTEEEKSAERLALNEHGSWLNDTIGTRARGKRRYGVFMTEESLGAAKRLLCSRRLLRQRGVRRPEDVTAAHLRTFVDVVSCQLRVPAGVETMENASSAGRDAEENHSSASSDAGSGSGEEDNFPKTFPLFVARFKGRQNWELAHGQTIHSMQGRQKKRVVYLLTKRNMFMVWPQIYTAWTRAEEQVLLVMCGSYEDVEDIVANRNTQCNSDLGNYIRQAIGPINDALQESEDLFADTQHDLDASVLGASDGANDDNSNSNNNNDDDDENSIHLSRKRPRGPATQEEEEAGLPARKRQKRSNDASDAST